MVQKWNFNILFRRNEVAREFNNSTLSAASLYRPIRESNKYSPVNSTKYGFNRDSNNNFHLPSLIGARTPFPDYGVAIRWRAELQ